MDELKEITPEKYQKFKDLGWNDARINAALERNGFRAPKGFVERTGEGVIAGAKTIKSGINTAADAINQGNYSGAASTLLAKTGAGISSAVLSPVVEGAVSVARNVVPEGVRTAFGGFAESIGESAWLREAMSEYQSLKEKPGVAPLLATGEGILETAANVLTGGAAKTATKPVVGSIKKNLINTAETGLKSAEKAAERNAADRIIKIVGPATGEEAGAKKVGKAVLREAGQADGTVVKGGLVGPLKTFTATAPTRETKDLARLFPDLADGGNPDELAKKITNTIAKIEAERVAVPVASDASQTAFQRSANTRYFSSGAGKFKDSLLKNTDDILGVGEGASEKMADFLLSKVSARIVALGDTKILQAVDEGIRDFNTSVKTRFPRAFEAGRTGQGDILANQIRVNAREELARAINGSTPTAGEKYMKLGLDESTAMKARSNFENRYSTGFGKSQVKEALKKVSPAQGIAGAAATVGYITGAFFFPTLVGAISALGATGAAAYLGLTRPALRKVLFKSLRNLSKRLPDASPMERKELLEQIAIGVSIITSKEFAEEAKE